MSPLPTPNKLRRQENNVMTNHQSSINTKKRKEKKKKKRRKKRKSAPSVSRPLGPLRKLAQLDSGSGTG